MVEISVVAPLCPLRRIGCLNVGLVDFVVSSVRCPEDYAERKPFLRMGM
jgi:hypothetical protein